MLSAHEANRITDEFLKKDREEWERKPHIILDKIEKMIREDMKKLKKHTRFSKPDGAVTLQEIADVLEGYGYTVQIEKDIMTVSWAKPNKQKTFTLTSVKKK